MTTCSKCSKCSQGHPRRQIKRQSSGGKGSWSENRGQRSGLADAAAAEVEESDCLTQTGTGAPGGARLFSSSASPCFCNHSFLGTPHPSAFISAWSDGKDSSEHGESPLSWILPVRQLIASIQWPVCTEDTRLRSFTKNCFKNPWTIKQTNNSPHSHAKCVYC